MIRINGVEYPWLPDIPVMLGEQKEDWTEDNMLLARRSLADQFRDIPPPPPYDVHGVYVQAMVPFGQVGCYVFLAEDPDAFYAVPHGTSDGFREGLVPYIRRTYGPHK